MQLIQQTNKTMTNKPYKYKVKVAKERDNTNHKKVGVEQILDFWQNLPEFPFSTRHYQWSFFFEFELGRFDHHIHWFFILANITGSHFNNFSISEIIFIFALCFLPISNPHPMIVHRKVKPCDQKQRVSSRDQEFFWQKFLVFL